MRSFDTNIQQCSNTLWLVTIKTVQHLILQYMFEKERKRESKREWEREEELTTWTSKPKSGTPVSCTYSLFSVDIHTVSSTKASFWSVVEMAGTVSTVTISVSVALNDSMSVSRVVCTETSDTWARVSEVVTTHRCCMLMSELAPPPDRYTGTAHFTWLSINQS